MQLTEEQKQKVRAWAEEGCGLSEVQRRLNTECGLAMTYMDVRFLVLELGVTIREKVRPKDKAKPAGAATAPAGGEPGDALGDEAVEEEAGAPAPGAGVRLSLTVDRLMKPGCLVSGSVTFSDGVTGQWVVDQYGRPGFTKISKEGYRPTPGDAQAFMQQLSAALQKQGY